MSALRRRAAQLMPLALQQSMSTLTKNLRSEAKLAKQQTGKLSTDQPSLVVNFQAMLTL